jgi:FkbM family methyltransferase
MKRLTSTVTGNLVTHSFLYSGRYVVITCENDTRIDTCIRAGRWYEHKMLGLITRTARAGVFLDIGGNIGHHTLYFSLFCPSTKVYTFEPLPEHCELIWKNVVDNGLDKKVGIHPMGGAEKISSFEMTTNASKFARRITSICFPIDLTLSEPVSVIKIDVEGMEEQVLRGLKLTLSRDRPDIYVECLTDEQLYRVTEVLSCYGYVKDSTDFGLGLTHKFIHKDIDLRAYSKKG